jgi:hypothetical protein
MSFAEELGVSEDVHLKKKKALQFRAGKRKLSSFGFKKKKKHTAVGRR